MAIDDAKGKMDKILAGLKTELSRVRTGRASPSLLEISKWITTEFLRRLAKWRRFRFPDPKTLQIASWDQSAIPLIEKAIVGANIGLTPNVDGKLIRLNVPALTEDRRKDIAKQIKKLGEDSKVAMRNVRREANESVKAQEKAKAFSEDEAKKQQDQIQKVTDSGVAEVDKLIDSKTKDVMTV